MSRIPLGSGRGNATWHPWLTDHYEMISQGIAAERIAKKCGISRQELDAFSLGSHRKAIAAREAFREEIVPVYAVLPDGSELEISQDDGPRANTSMEKLQLLPPYLIQKE